MSEETDFEREEQYARYGLQCNVLLCRDHLSERICGKESQFAYSNLVVVLDPEFLKREARYV